MKNQIVFVDQSANADRRKVKSYYGDIDDIDAAKRFGVRLYKEYSFWAWRSCAIADVAMILKSEGLFDGTLYELVCKALQMNGYVYRNRKGKFDIGWKHNVLSKLLQSYGLKAKTVRCKNLIKIKTLLEEGKYVVLSVRSKSGGHMVLVKSIIGENIIYNNPSFFSGKGGENILESLKSFEERFLGRGIVAW